MEMWEINSLVLFVTKTRGQKETFQLLETVFQWDYRRKELVLHSSDQPVALNVNCHLVVASNVKYLVLDLSRLSSLELLGF